MGLTTVNTDYLKIGTWDYNDDPVFAESTDPGNTTAWGLNHNWREIYNAINSIHDGLALESKAAVPDAAGEPLESKPGLWLNSVDDRIHLQTIAVGDETLAFLSDINSLDPQESVIEFIDFTTLEPGTPNVGDRYINTVTGTSSGTTQAVTIDYIYQWNGVDWTEIVPDHGTFLMNEDDNNMYYYTGSAWVNLGTIVAHNDTTGKQGGASNEYYHLNASNNSVLTGFADDANEQISQLVTNGSPTFASLQINGSIGVTGTVDSVDVAGLKSDFDTLVSYVNGFPVELKNLTAAEITQLENINTTTISIAQWGYLGGMDQGVAIADAPEFAGVKLKESISSTPLGGATGIWSFYEGGGDEQHIAFDSDALRIVDDQAIYFGTDIDAGISYNSSNAALQFESSSGDFTFRDQWLSGFIPLSESGTTALVGFAATSIIGALNEAKAGDTITCKVNEVAGISAGDSVYISGATGQFSQVSLSDNTISAKAEFFGLATETKANNQNIQIATGGSVGSLNTSAWSDGDKLYMFTAGALTNILPTAGKITHMGYVEYDHASNGKIVITFHQESYIAVPSGEDIDIRMGDDIGGNKVNFENYSDVEVASIDSLGNFLTAGDIGLDSTNFIQWDSGDAYISQNGSLNLDIFCNQSISIKSEDEDVSVEHAGNGYFFKVLSAGVEKFSVDYQGSTIMDGGLTVNNDALGLDIIYKKQTSGIAYQYDTSTDQHGWGIAPTSDWHFYLDDDTDIEFLIENGSDPGQNVQYTLKNISGEYQCRLTSAGNFAIRNENESENIIQLQETCSIQALLISNTQVEFNPDLGNLDFVINGDTVEVFRYDAGANVFDINSPITQVVRRTQTLTDAASISWDLTNGTVADVTLTDNRTLANASNYSFGTVISILVIQDAGGTNTLAFGANYTFDGGITPIVSDGANEKTLLRFECINSGEFHCIGVSYDV